jgi:hypothetical protein
MIPLCNRQVMQRPWPRPFVSAVPDAFNTCHYQCSILQAETYAYAPLPFLPPPLRVLGVEDTQYAHVCITAKRAEDADAIASTRYCNRYVVHAWNWIHNGRYTVD